MAKAPPCHVLLLVTSVAAWAQQNRLQLFHGVICRACLDSPCQDLSPFGGFKATARSPLVIWHMCHGPRMDLIKAWPG